jgi:hypothetical protein
LKKEKQEMTKKKPKYSTVLQNKTAMDGVANDLKSAGEEHPEEIPQPDPGSAPPVQPDPLKS